MKSETTNTVLNFALTFLAILGVIFALQTIFRTRDLRALQTQALSDNNNLLRFQSLANETYAYNQKNPSLELTRLLQSIQAKPATH